MSKFGETADSILEMLENGEKIDVGLIKKELMLSDLSVLIFMDEFGIIELKDGTAKITEPGLEFLNDCFYS